MRQGLSRAIAQSRSDWRWQASASRAFGQSAPCCVQPRGAQQSVEDIRKDREKVQESSCVLKTLQMLRRTPTIIIDCHCRRAVRLLRPWRSVKAALCLILASGMFLSAQPAVH